VLPLEQGAVIATMQHGLVYDYSGPFVHLCAFGPSLFTGKERDTESGNDYFGARYYGSSMGRMMSPDWSAKVMPVPYLRLENPQSLNLYSYVWNNPLSRNDPDGHYVCNGDECKQVKQALEDVKKAIKSGNLSKDEKAALKDVVKFYGKAGKDNGVTVNTGTGSGAGLGKTATESGRTTISLNLSSLDSSPNGGTPSTEKAAEVAHEGEHGVQQKANGMPATPDQTYKAEQQAYTAQSFVNKGLNTDSSWGVWTTSGGFNQNAVDETAADSTRLAWPGTTWTPPE
jgi:RHS repeat-associated protein